MSRRAMLVASLIVVTLMQLATAGQAQAPDVHGWWWSVRDVALPVDVPAPAEVPEGGLFVAANLTGDEAISAVLFVIPEGATASTLTLKAANVVPPVAEIQLCPTTTSWQAAQAGDWPARPKYACADNAPKGEVAADGSAVTFNLGALGTSQLIDVAIVPVPGSTFRAAFVKPDTQALAVKAPSSSSSSSSATTPESFDSTPSFVPDASSVNTPIFASDFSSSVQPLPQAAEQPVIGAAPQLGLSSRGIATGRPVPSDDRMQTFGMFGLILIAALWSRYSSQTQRAPQSLINVAHWKDGTAPAEAQA